MRGKNQGLSIRQFHGRILFFLNVCLCIWLCCSMQDLDGSTQESLRWGSWTPVVAHHFSCPTARGILVPLTRCQTDMPRFGRGILKHWTTGEAPALGGGFLPTGPLGKPPLWKGDSLALDHWGSPESCSTPVLSNGNITQNLNASYIYRTPQVRSYELYAAFFI